jgi:hypothetical protein
MAKDIASAKRGIPIDELPPISISWVRAFRARNSFGNLRASTTDRPSSSLQDLQADDDWRDELEDICNHPGDYGLAWDGTIPPQCVLGLDETPLPYGVKLKTYDRKAARTVLVMGSKEKRMVTGVKLSSSIFFCPLCCHRLPCYESPRGPNLFPDYLEGYLHKVPSKRS